MSIAKTHSTGCQYPDTDNKLIWEDVGIVLTLVFWMF